MNIPTKLTPFSHSILHPALASSLERLAQAFSSHAPTLPHSFHSQAVNTFLAQATLGIWGGSEPEIGHLFGIEPPTAPRQGKPSQGMKQARVALREFPAAYARLRRWSEWVFASEWSQAQLLQVMEEIEPRVAEALNWVHRCAIVTVGSYHHLGTMLAKKEKDNAKREALRLGLVAGLETPDSRFLHALAVGKPVDELRATFGHMPLAREGEIAAPRVGDAAEHRLTNPGMEVWNWTPGRAQKRRGEAEKQALAQAGMLGRSGLRKAVEMAQQALVAHAQAREALAYVLAAARHWALAAAEEGAADGRIHHPDEIFMLEIEEIKQMMTGEWHSRAHVETLITERRAAYDAQPDDDAGHGHPLGVAGYDTEGALFLLQHPEEADQLDVPPGFMALARGWHPGWWQVVLKAEGIIDRGGNILTWMASVARSGDLPALTGGASYATWSQGVRIRLIPTQNRAEIVE